MADGLEETRTQSHSMFIINTYRCTRINKAHFRQLKRPRDKKLILYQTELYFVLSSRYTL